MADATVVKATRATLSEAQKALLEQRLRGQGTKSAGRAPVIPRREPGVEVPLSFAQQRLWFMEQMEPGRSIYNIPLALRLSGPLDADTVEQSLNEIVRRHEMLRTIFVLHAGQPVQRIQPAFAVAVERSDVSGCGAPEAEAARIISEDSAAPFVLEAAPLFRVRLIRLKADESILLLVWHHIVFDGWSIGLFLEEFSALHRGYKGGEPARLPELVTQYADFAAWQRSGIWDSILAEQLAYWKKQLDGMRQTIELPTDRPRPAAMSFRGAIVRDEWLSREGAERLREFCHLDPAGLVPDAAVPL
jgi:hypothetical protein